MCIHSIGLNPDRSRFQGRQRGRGRESERSGILVESMIWLGLNPAILVVHSCLQYLALEEIVSMKTTKLWMVQIWHYFSSYVQWFKTVSIISVLSSQLMSLRILFAGRLPDDCFLKEIQFITSNSNISHYYYYYYCYCYCY